jgi:Ca2+-binding RTX toxin-like protein
VITGNSGNNILAGLGGADTLDGGAGVDTATYAASLAGVFVSLMSGLGSGGDAEGDTLINIENLTGSAFGDALEGNAGNNVLSGGAGIDTVSYEHATVGVTVSLALTSAQNTLGAGTDVLTNFENVTGSNFNDILTGKSGANVLTGLDGNDVLNGGGSADTMIGGAGDDIYVVNNVGDVVDETGGNGIDTIKSSITFSLADSVHVNSDVEHLTLTGPTAINGTGNTLANVITGNSGNNILAGLGGADTLDGGAGVDTATYAASPSGVNVSLMTALGSGGDAEGDTLINIENLTGSAFDDALEGNSGNNLLAGGAGLDAVFYAHATAGVTVNLALTSAQNTIGAGTDTLSGFENVTGSDFNDTLRGTAGANTIVGGAGNDTITGGGGADTLYGASGADTFVFAALADSAPATPDVIKDFEAGVDKIHLSAIDANTAVTGNQAFLFGGQNLNVVANSVTWFETGGNTIVQADDNGDMTADLKIVLHGTGVNLHATDFVL